MLLYLGLYYLIVFLCWRQIPLYNLSLFLLCIQKLHQIHRNWLFTICWAVVVSCTITIQKNEKTTHTYPQSSNHHSLTSLKLIGATFYTGFSKIPSKIASPYLSTLPRARVYTYTFASLLARARSRENQFEAPRARQQNNANGSARVKEIKSQAALNLLRLDKLL